MRPRRTIYVCFDCYDYSTGELILQHISYHNMVQELIIRFVEPGLRATDIQLRMISNYI